MSNAWFIFIEIHNLKLYEEMEYALLKNQFISDN